MEDRPGGLRDAGRDWERLGGTGRDWETPRDQDTGTNWEIVGGTGRD